MSVAAPAVLHIEYGKPRTGHLKVAEFLNAVRGAVCICDPYLRQGTLKRLDELKEADSVGFLTCKLDGKVGLKPRLEEIRDEYGGFEFGRRSRYSA